MDKYEYKIRSEEIKALIAEGDYTQAAEIADTIDWRRVKSVMTLCTISDLYKINRRYEDAKNMLLLAYERRPGGRTICYSLCELCIKTEEFVQALRYYKEFAQASPKDPSRFVLQYKLYEAQDVSLEERIGVLEELKKRDYREKWAYELAFLYHRVGLATQCVEECDEMILWFGEGKYVIKAMELKMLHQPLTPIQQEMYDHRFDKDAEEAQLDEAGQEEFIQEEPQQPVEEQPPEPAQAPADAERQAEATQQEEIDIQVKTVDVGKYNTINLQAELAAGLEEVLGKEDIAQPTVETGMEPDAGIQSDKEKETFSETVQDTGESEEIEVFFGETGEISETLEEISEKDTVVDTAVSSFAVQPPKELADVLSQEANGQISIVVPDTVTVEKQLTGQMKIEDILAEWAKMKKAREERCREEVRQRVLKETGPMFTEFEEAIRDGLLEQLEKGTVPEDVGTALATEEALEDGAVLDGVSEPDVVDTALSENVTEMGEREITEGEYEELLEESGDTGNEEEQADSQEYVEDKQLVYLEDTEDEGQLDNQEYIEEEDGQLNELEYVEEEDGQLNELEYVEEEDGQLNEPEYVEEEDGQLNELEYVEEEDGQFDEAEYAEEKGRQVDAIEYEEDTGSQPDNLEYGEEPPAELEYLEDDKSREGAVAEEEDTEKEAKCEEDPEPAEEQRKENQKEAAENEPPVRHESAKVRGLTREEKELYAPFIQSRSSREQLVQAIDSISMAAYTGNVVITGEEGMDTLTLAKNMIRELRMTDSNFAGKVAKITGQGLNGRNVKETLERLNNGALIIQKASNMDSVTADTLHKQLQQERLGIIVVLEDTKKAVGKLFAQNPDLEESFTARVDLEALSNDTLVSFGRLYAREMEYSIDDLGVLALHTRIEELQTIDHVVTVIEVKQIVDDAINRASRKTLRHFFDILFAKRYDNEDMVILTEKDFVA